MPKALELGGFKVYVYVRNERGHRPHVHVWGKSGELVVLLDDAVTIRDRRGMTLSEARRAKRVVAEHRDELLEIWRYYHGD